MLRGSELLGAVRGWISRAEQVSADSGASSEIEESPGDRNPRSIRWILESPEMMSQIILWEDGQSEFDLIDVATSEVRSEHRQIDSQQELDQVLKIVREWVIRS
jgi:hypothetical protein